MSLACTDNNLKTEFGDDAPVGLIRKILTSLVGKPKKKVSPSEKEIECMAKALYVRFHLATNPTTKAQAEKDWSNLKLNAEFDRESGSYKAYKGWYACAEEVLS